MAREILNNKESLLAIRTKINSNFQELFADIVEIKQSIQNILNPPITPTPTPTSTSTPTPTSTSTPTPTLSPTSTPTPTPTVSETPTPTPTQT
jgi:hypothetical protein